MPQPVRTDLDMLSVSKVVNLPNPSSAQDAATKAYVDSTIEGLNWKDSVRAATTANINLSAPGAAIDGVTLAASDRILVKDQTTTSQNGIYVWNGAATPATRALDATPFSELEAAVVMVEEGSTNGATTWRQTQVNGTIDSSNVVWTAFGSAVAAASETVAGIAEIGTQTEVDTGTDDARIVSPLKLANWSGRKRKHTATFGDGAATSYTITHNFNTKDVTVEVYEASGNERTVFCEIRHNNVNSIDLVFSSAPASNSLKVVILG